MKNYSFIPAEMKPLPQWVCWKGDKVPKNPITGFNAQSNNPDTWCTFDQAIDACKKFGFDGIGFVFKKDGDFFGVDLDNCIQDKECCNEFVNTLKSYSEYSKSGSGLHIICKGELPEGNRRRGNVEMYSEGRYFICTGNIYDQQYSEIVDCTESVKDLYQK